MVWIPRTTSADSLLIFLIMTSIPSSGSLDNISFYWQSASVIILFVKPNLEGISLYIERAKLKVLLK